MEEVVDNVQYREGLCVAEIYVEIDELNSPGVLVLLYLDVLDSSYFNFACTRILP